MADQASQGLRCCYTSVTDCGDQVSDCCFSNAWVWPGGLIVVIASAIRILIELAQIAVQRSNYLTINNCIEVLLFVSSIYFCSTIFNGNSNIISDVQWQIGVFSVFVAWMDLIMFLRKVDLLI